MTAEFGSFGAFAEHLAAQVITLAAVSERALEKSAKLVEEHAKAKFGEYQPAAGPFPAWAPLAESTLAEKERLGYSPPDNPLLRTEETRDSIQHKVISPREAAVGSDSEVLVYHELGTSRMPPRPVLGPAAVEKADEVALILGSSVALAVSAGGDVGVTVPGRLPEKAAA